MATEPEAGQGDEAGDEEQPAPAVEAILDRQGEVAGDGIEEIVGRLEEAVDPLPAQQKAAENGAFVAPELLDLLLEAGEAIGGGRGGSSSAIGRGNPPGHLPVGSFLDTDEETEHQREHRHREDIEKQLAQEDEHPDPEGDLPEQHLNDPTGAEGKEDGEIADQRHVAEDKPLQPHRLAEPGEIAGVGGKAMPRRGSCMSRAKP